MTEDRRQPCLNCAWRANPHCPDYKEDVALREAEKSLETATLEEG